MRLTILIFCFNEKATILKAIDQARSISIDKEIIVIDNASTDGTKELLQEISGDKDLRIVLHDKNRGVGYSALEGIRLAKGDYLYAPYADLEYKMEDVYKMMDKIENEKLDIVFGSRLLGRKDTSIFTLFKERPYWLGTIIATFLINLLYRRSFTDIISTKLIKTEILKNLKCEKNNHCYEFELVSRLCKKGYRIEEVYVWYKARTRAQGKTIRVYDMLPAIWIILKVKFF